MASDMYPADPVEALKVDMITDHSEDIRGSYIRLIYQNFVSAPFIVSLFME
jgi:hypothetical protein